MWSLNERIPSLRAETAVRKDVTHSSQAMQNAPNSHLSHTKWILIKAVGWHVVWSLQEMLWWLCYTETHAAVVSGPVYHRLVMRWVSRQRKSISVQVRLTLSRVRPSGFLPCAPVLDSRAWNTLDSLQNPLPWLRLSTFTPIHILACTNAPFFPLLGVKKFVLLHHICHRSL